MSLVIDRVTASRLGIAPTTIDNTLYDAFGQRQINTMYTQLNQYHVILEAQPQFQLDPDMLNHIFIQANAAAGTSGAGASSFIRPRFHLGGIERAHCERAVHAFGQLRLDACDSRVTRPRRRDRGAQLRPAQPAAAPSHPIPLSAFSHFETTTEPLSITHQGQFPAITVSFNLAPNASLGTRHRPRSTSCRKT